MYLTESPISGLLTNEYEFTSPKNSLYNALAWAVGGEDEQERWWSPEPFDCYYWPEGVAKEETLETYVEIFRIHGFVACEGNNKSPEAGFEKVAIYCKYGIPTHIAKQLNNGWWTSKLGKAQDITHQTLTCLEGEKKYGTVYRILKRERK